MSELNPLLQIFVSLFTNIYPYLHNHFVSYLLLLSLLILSAKFVWSIIKKMKKTKTFLEKTIKLALYGFGGFLVVYIAWFVLIHFHTFTVLP